MESDADDFVAGTAFHTVRGGRVGNIDRLLGAGGQGAVYSADLGATRFALKWYHPSYAEVDVDLRARLSRAIERGPPNDAFLWPIDLVEITGQPSFGYLMRLRDADHVGMRDLIARPPARIEPSLATRATMCLHLAQSFLELHASGFCYQDVNFGNVFFRPDDGHILICDNDNVDIDGGQACVFGTRKFMAPEIVRREAMPSTKSDLFSMAVLFFYVLHAWHPLDGKLEAAVDFMDATTETMLYGRHPVFLFDPVDTSNGPLAGMHEPIEARWLALPGVVRALFVRSFTVGLHQPGSRVQEAEWCAAFAALAAASFACAGCGFEHAVELAPGAIPIAAAQCRCCGGVLKRPPVLAIGRNAVCLSPGCRIPLHALIPGQRLDVAVCGATVEEHPTKPGLWGLRNRSEVAWRAQLRDKSAVAVPPGNTMRLLDGTVIEFGGRSGTIVMSDATQVAERYA